MATPALIPATSTTSGWNTLRRLKAGRAVILALDGFLLLAILYSTDVHREAMKTVGVKTAPSIIHAQHIKASLADMDADAANELLAAGGASTAPYEKRRGEGAEALINAARDIDFEPEVAPLQILQVGLGSYERDIQRARDLHEDKSPAFVAAYRDAAKVMDTTLLPAADTLDKANNDELEGSYAAQSSRSLLGTVAIVAAGGALAVALIAAQVFLSRRTRRTLNPLLALSTLGVLALTMFAASAMRTEQVKLRIATEDAFHSIHALWRARALAYEANSEESRFLLDPASAATEERAFVAEANTLASLPGGTTPERVVVQEAKGIPVAGFTGLLADELNNITFDGEREAAVATLSSFERYLGVDANLRRLERSGAHAQAIALCLGTRPGESDWAFEQFDNALEATLKINQRAFDDAVNEGLAALNHMELESAMAAVLLAVLVVLGFAPRVREYQ